MGWLFKKKEPQAVSIENPSVNLIDINSWEEFFGLVSDGTIAVNEKTALQSATAFRCVSLIAGTIASLPFKVFRDSDGIKKPATKHRLYYRIHSEPNARMSSHRFRQLLMVYALLWGNAYVLIGRKGSGQVVDFTPIPPWLVQITTTRSGDIFYDVTYEASKAERIPAYNMIHIAGIGYDVICGLSPVQLMKRSIELSLNAELFAANMHKTGVIPSGVIEAEGKMSLEALENLKKTFLAAYQGAKNAGIPIFLDNGMTWKNASVTATDAQTLEQRQFQVTEIARIFGVPPHLIGQTEKSTSYGTGVEQQTIGFVQYSIQPWLSNIEQEFNRKIFGNSAFHCQFVVEGLLRGDSKARSEFYSKAVQNGWMTVNEVRKRENLPPVEHGDTPYVQSNLMKVGESHANASSQTIDG